MKRKHFLTMGIVLVSLVMVLAMNAAAQADETGVVRISDRTAQPVIRAQSPDRSLIEQTNCQSGAYGTSCRSTACESSCPPHGIRGPGMLYEHEYRAMYPPFYYRVKGCWILTPLGVKQHEVWKLQGTEVKVNYRAHRSPFGRFFRAPR